MNNKITWESDKGEKIHSDADYWFMCILSEHRYSGWQIYEPKPHYQVGDWVEWSESLGKTYQSKITRVSNSAVYSNGLCIPLKIITHKLKPSEVVLDFGSGIKGTIRFVAQIPSDTLIRVTNGHVNCARIFISCLTEPMKTTVLELLKAQDGE